MARSSTISRLAICLCFLLFAGAGLAQKKDEKPAGQVETIESLNLTLTFPASFGVKPMPPRTDPQIVGAWSGTCGNASFSLGLRALPLDQYHLDGPHDVLDMVLENHTHYEPSFAFDEQRTIPGPFGMAPYAICARTVLREPVTAKTSGVEFFLCGTTDKHGYIVDLTLQPMPDAAALVLAREFLAKGIAWKGKPPDPKWTNEECAARWDKDVPDAKKNELDNVLRTEHYVILTNSSGGKLFAKKMEECYTKIKAVFAFEELPGERLMPVFLFRNPDEYFGFFSRQFDATLVQARQSKGVAYRDFYATWYEAAGDPVHIHEGTHQIFANRLHLGGGGSWFQEGVAEYMSTMPNDRNVAARLVKKGRQMPLAKFVVIESLLFSPKKESKSGEDDASSQYELAAFLIEFARESKFSKDRFVDWVRAIGSAPRNDLKGIEDATKKTLGVDLAGFEREWVEFAKKR